MQHLTKSAFRTSKLWRYRCLRHTNRPCSPLSLVALSKTSSFVSAVFASMYDLTLKFTALRKLARKLQTMHRWGSSNWFAAMTITRFNKSWIYRNEETCSKASDNASLRELQNSPLWKSFKHQDLHRWESLHGSFRLIKIAALGRRHRRMLWENVEKYNLRNDKCAKINWYNLTKEELMRSYWV